MLRTFRILKRFDLTELRMTGCQRVILVISLLLQATLHAVRGLDLSHGISSTSSPEIERLTNELESLGIGNGKTIYSNGIKWNILSKALESSSGNEVLSRNIHCAQEGLNPVPGSCKSYIYCKDLSEEGFEDWYILFFTCPEDHFFEVSSAKCRHYSSITGHPECQPKIEPHVRGEALSDSFLEVKELRENPNITHKISRPSVGNSLEDDKACDDVDQVECHIPAKKELEESHDLSLNEDMEKKLQSLNLSEQDIRSGREETYEFAGVISQDRKTRSVTTLENVVDRISQNNADTCNDIKSISRYVSHVRSRKSLAFTYDKEDMVKTTLEAYNQNLKSAQTNTNSWDKDNGILKAVTLVFNLVKKFAPDFETQFLNIETTIGDISKKEETEIEIFQKDINVLKKEIEELEALIKSTDNKVALEYYNLMLAQCKLELSKMVKVGFPNLVVILEYLLRNSREIQTESAKATRLMESFKVNIYRDRGNFEDAISKVKTSRTATTKRIKENREKITNHLSRINAAEKDIENKKVQIRNLERSMEEYSNRIYIERKRLHREMQRAHDRAELGRNLIWIPIGGWIAGPILINEGIQRMETAIRTMEAIMTSYRSQLRTHYSIFDSLIGLVRSERRHIDSLSEKAADLERRIDSLQEIDGTLQRMESDVISVLPFINNAVSSLVSLNRVFSSVEVELTEVKSRADSAKTQAELQDSLFFTLDSVVETIQVPWKGAIYKIFSVEQCVPSD